MKCILFLVLLSIYNEIDAYPDLRIDYLACGWRVSGRTSYVGCRSEDFVLKQCGQHFIEP